MIDETDPVVRAIQAPFEANMGDFYRRIKDANASYQEEMDKLDKEKAEAEEERRRQLDELAKGKAPEPEKPARPSQEWDYNDPLASAQPEPRRWPSTLPSPQHAAPARHESTSDDEEPVYERRRYRATWAEPASEPEPEAQPWSPPPAAPPPEPAPSRRSRPVAHDDEDYSNESWLQ